MKTKAMKHQVEGARRLDANPEYYALGAEQGTGKTWMLLNDAERQFEAGAIEGLLVIAPKGVHTNWILREIPNHMGTEYLAEFWLSGAGKRHMARLEKFLTNEPKKALMVMAINVDAVNTKKGLDYVQRFLRRYRCMIVIDESQRIKNPAAKRTKRILSLAPFAVSRRIASGTLVANSPNDLFAQYEFLRTGLLGTTSHRAFVAEFSELLPPNHPMVQEIASRSRGGSSPQIVKRDRDGNPKFKNLEKLSALMSPVTFRVLKKDCLDLPEKIYKVHDFEMTPTQRRLYDGVKEDLRYERADGEIDIFTALTLINKLQQITSGFIMVDGEPTELKEAKPRMDALKEILEDCEGQVIIFAKFKEELRHIAGLYPDSVQYHGSVSTKDREIAVDSFQAGKVKYFIGNPAAAGTGLTLTAASTVIYYSCSYNFEERSQSEDRAHRIGTKQNVVYIDLVARNSIDERIANALTMKARTASQILDNL